MQIAVKKSRSKRRKQPVFMQSVQRYTVNNVVVKMTESEAKVTMLLCRAAREGPDTEEADQPLFVVYTQKRMWFEVTDKDRPAVMLNKGCTREAKKRTHVMMIVKRRKEEEERRQMLRSKHQLHVIKVFPAKDDR